MFIDVEKVIEVYEKDGAGRHIPDPRNSDKNLIQGYTSKVESIDTSDIKSFRAWDKNKTQNNHLEKDLTLIYFKGGEENKPGESKKPAPQMLIHESHASFSKRLGSIQLPEED